MGNTPVSLVYVCVHVPEFPAQAMVRLRPELARLPVVVLQGEAPLEQVCSVSVRAQRMGVRHAVSRAELDSFTGLSIFRRSPAEERSARSALLGAAGMFTPRVEVQPDAANGWTMVLDMAGSTSLFGPVAQATGRVQHAMKALHFTVSVAASSNLHTAVCLAAAASRGSLQTRVRTPVVVPQGEEAVHLAPLPLSALGLSAQQAEAFELWGLHTVGELAGLSEVDLIVRLGQEGKRLRMLARGEHPHLMVPEEPVFALEEFLELDAPVDLLDSLLFVLGPMLRQLIARAQNHAFALASVTVRLGLDGGGDHQRTIKPALPVADRDLLLKLLHLDLQAHPPPAAVLSVFVSAVPGERSKVQLGLFSPQLPEPMRLDVTLARIAALVGEERVGRAKLLDTHRPESFTMERFLVPAASGKRGQRANAAVALRRCRPPVAIQMRQEGKRLSAFHLRGTLYAIEQAYGPWRRSGDWWSPQVWSTEEWDVQATAQGNTQGNRLLCVISHDLLRRHWQLEGMYD